jgi:chromosome segregation ATPase
MSYSYYPLCAQALQSLSAGQVNSPRKTSQQRAEAKKKTHSSSVCLEKDNAKRFAEQQCAQLESLAQVTEHPGEVEEHHPATPTLRLRETPAKTPESIIPNDAEQEEKEEQDDDQEEQEEQENQQPAENSQQDDERQQEQHGQKENHKQQQHQVQENESEQDHDSQAAVGKGVQELESTDIFETAVAFKHMPTFRRKLHAFVSEKGNLVCELEKLKTELERLRGQKNSHDLAMDYMCRRVIKFQQTLRVRELNLRTFFMHLSGSQQRLEESSLTIQAAQQQTSGTVGQTTPSLAQIAQWHQLCVGSCQASLHNVKKVVACSERVVQDAAQVCSELYKLSTKQDITRGGKDGNVGAELLQVAYCRDKALLKLEQKSGDVNKLEAEISERNTQLERMCEQLGDLQRRLMEDGRVEGLLQIAEFGGGSNGSNGWSEPQEIVHGITVVISHLQAKYTEVHCKYTNMNSKYVASVSERQQLAEGLLEMQQQLQASESAVEALKHSSSSDERSALHNLKSANLKSKEQRREEQQQNLALESAVLEHQSENEELKRGLELQRQEVDALKAEVDTAESRRESMRQELLDSQRREHHKRTDLVRKLEAAQEKAEAEEAKCAVAERTVAVKDSQLAKIASAKDAEIRELESKLKEEEKRRMLGEEKEALIAQLQRELAESERARESATKNLKGLQDDKQQVRSLEAQVKCLQASLDDAHVSAAEAAAGAAEMEAEAASSKYSQVETGLKREVEELQLKLAAKTESLESTLTELKLSTDAKGAMETRICEFESAATAASALTREVEVLREQFGLQKVELQEAKDFGAKLGLANEAKWRLELTVKRLEEASNETDIRHCEELKIANEKLHLAKEKLHLMQERLEAKEDSCKREIGREQMAGGGSISSAFEQNHAQLLAQKHVQLLETVKRKDLELVVANNSLSAVEVKLSTMEASVSALQLRLGTKTDELREARSFMQSCGDQVREAREDGTSCVRERQQELSRCHAKIQALEIRAMSVESDKVQQLNESEAQRKRITGLLSRETDLAREVEGLKKTLGEQATDVHEARAQTLVLKQHVAELEKQLEKREAESDRHERRVAALLQQVQEAELVQLRADVKLREQQTQHDASIAELRTAAASAADELRMCAAANQELKIQLGSTKVKMTCITTQMFAANASSTQSLTESARKDERVSALLMQVDDLRDALARVQQEHARLMEEMQRKKSEEMQTKESVISLRRQLQQRDEELVEVGYGASGLRSRQASLEQELLTRIAEIDRLNLHRVDLETQLIDTKESYSKLRGEKDALEACTEEEMEAKTAECIQSLELNRKLADSVRRLEADNVSMRGAAGEREAEVARLLILKQNADNEAHQLTTEKEEATLALHSLESNLEAKVSSLQSLSQEMQLVQSVRVELESHQADQTQRMQETVQELCLLKSEKADTDLMVQKLQAELVQLHEQLAENVDEIGRLSAAKDRVESAVEKLESDLEELQSTNVSMRADVENKELEITCLSVDKRNMCNMIAKLESANMVLRGEIESTADECTLQMEGCVQGMQDALRTAEVDLSKLRKELRDKESSIRSLVEAKGESAGVIAELNLSKKRLLSAGEKLQQVVEANTSEVVRLTEEKRSVGDALTTLESSHSSLQHELEAKVTELTQQREIGDAAQAVVQQFEAEQTSLKEALEGKISDAASLAGRLAHAEAAKGIADEALSDLQSKHALLVHVHGQVVEEATVMKAAKEELDNAMNKLGLAHAQDMQNYSSLRSGVETKETEAAVLFHEKQRLHVSLQEAGLAETALQSKLATKTAECIQSLELNRKLADSVRRLEADNVSMRGAAGEREAEVARLVVENGDMTNLQSTLDENTVEIQRICAESKKFEKYAASLETEKAGLHKAAAELREQNRKMGEESRKMGDSLDELAMRHKAEHKGHQAAIKRLKAVTKAHTIEVARLREENGLANEQVEQLQSSCVLLQEANDVKTAELARLAEEREAFQDKTVKLQSSMSALRHDMEEAHVAEVGRLNEEIVRLTNEHHTLEARAELQVAELESAVNGLEVEMATKTDEVAELAAARGELDEAIEITQVESERLQDDVRCKEEDIIRLSAGLHAADATIKQQTTTMSALQQEHGAKLVEIEQLTNTNTAATSALETLQSDNRSLRADMKAKSGEIERLVQIKGEVDKAMDRLEANAKVLGREVQSKTRRVTVLEEEQGALMSEVATMTAELESKQKDLDLTTQQSVKLQEGFEAASEDASTLLKEAKRWQEVRSLKTSKQTMELHVLSCSLSRAHFHCFIIEGA